METREALKDYRKEVVLLDVGSILHSVRYKKEFANMWAGNTPIWWIEGYYYATRKEM